jgi:hypothetical protein
MSAAPKKNRIWVKCPHCDFWQKCTVPIMSPIYVHVCDACLQEIDVCVEVDVYKTEEELAKLENPSIKE